MASAEVREEDDLACPICHNDFCSPKILPCGHTLCLEPCLIQLVEGKATLQCPECRESHPVPTTGAEAFPTNITINRMLNKRSVRPKKRSCPSCHKTINLVECFHCNLAVCEECRIMHTNEMKRNAVKTIKGFLKEANTIQIDELVKEAASGLATSMKTAKDEIQDAAEILKQATEQRKDRLLDKLKLYEEEQKAALSAQLTEMKDLLTKVKAVYISSEKKLATADFMATQGNIMTLMEKCEEQSDMMCVQKESLLNVPTVAMNLDATDVLHAICLFGSCQAEFQEAEPQTTKQPMENKTDIKTLLECGEELKLRKCVGSKGKLDGQFDNATCVAVSKETGQIFVGDSGNGRIQVFNDEAEHVKSLRDSEGKPFGYVLDVATGQAEYATSIFALVTTAQNQTQGNANCIVRIVRFNQEGLEPSTTFEVDNSSESFAVYRNNQIHVCCGTNGVKIYDMDGTHKQTYCILRETPQTAMHIVIFENGTMHVTGSDPMEDGYCTFNESFQLIFQTKPVSNKGKTGTAFYRWNEYRTLFGSNCGQITLVENHQFLVANSVTNRIELFDMAWKKLATFGTTGECRGQLYKPTGAAVTKNGHLLVVGGNNMMQIFSP